MALHRVSSARQEPAAPSVTESLIHHPRWLFNPPATQPSNSPPGTDYSPAAGCWPASSNRTAWAWSPGLSPRQPQYPARPAVDVAAPARLGPDPARLRSQVLSVLRARVPEAWLPAPLRPPAARQAHLDVLVMLALARGQEAAGAGLSGEVRAWLEVQARPGEVIVTLLRPEALAAGAVAPIMAIMTPPRARPCPSWA